MRPCTRIGKVYGVMEILDSRRLYEEGKHTNEYKIRCTKCGNIEWRNCSTVLRGSAKCYVCHPEIRRVGPKGSAKNAPQGLLISYRAMIQRCTGKNHDNYKWYGGRGIKVCPEWFNDFTAFKEWALANGWEQGKTLDRINPDGNYEPGNCRWTDMTEQANNNRSNIRLTYAGEEMTLAQFCKKTGANYDRARYLIFRKGISAEMALTMMQGVKP